MQNLQAPQFRSASAKIIFCREEKDGCKNMVIEQPFISNFETTAYWTLP